MTTPRNLPNQDTTSSMSTGRRRGPVPQVQPSQLPVRLAALGVIVALVAFAILAAPAEAWNGQPEGALLKHAR